jgi:hypothetical protein
MVIQSVEGGNALFKPFHDLLRQFWSNPGDIGQQSRRGGVGIHTYAAQFVPPAVAGLKCVNTMAAAAVRIINEKELRILYVQGALTWDAIATNLEKRLCGC